MTSQKLTLGAALLLAALFVLAACAQTAVPAVSPPLLLDTPSTAADVRTSLADLPQQIIVVVVTPTPSAGATGEASGSEVALNNAGGSASGSTGRSAAEASSGTSASPSQMSDQELINTGEQVFTSECARCHGENGEGGGEYPALAGNSFVTGEDISGPLETVLHGRGQMPSFRDQLSDQQIAGVLSYVRNAWGNSASVVQVNQVSQGGGQQAGGQQAGGQQAGDQQAGDQQAGGQQAGDQQAGGQQAGGQQAGGQQAGGQQAGGQEQADTGQATAQTPGQAGGQQAGGRQASVGVSDGGTVVTIRLEIMIVTPEPSSSGSAGVSTGGGSSAADGGMEGSANATPPAGTQGQASAPADGTPVASATASPAAAPVSSSTAQATPSPTGTGAAAPGAGTGSQGTPTTVSTPAASPAAGASSGASDVTGVTAGAAQVGEQAIPITVQIIVAVATPSAQPSAEGQPASAAQAGGEAQPQSEAQATPAGGAADPGGEPTPGAGVVQGSDESAPQTDQTQQNGGQSTGGGEEQGSASGQQLVERGSSVYTARCAACHQAGGQGIEGIYPPLAGNPFVTAEDPRQVLQVVLTGRGGMPHFGEYLSVEELAQVVSYVRNGWGNSASTVSPEQVSQAAEEFGSSVEVVEH